MTFKEEAPPKKLLKLGRLHVFFCITSYFLQFLFVSTKKRIFGTHMLKWNLNISGKAIFWQTLDSRAAVNFVLWRVRPENRWPTKT